MPGTFLPSFGTNTSFDTLKSSQQTIAQFGEDHAWDAVASLLSIFNAQAREVRSALVMETTDRLRRYGGATVGRMQRVDEVGIANAQKVKFGSIVGFPLERYETAIQWTRTFFYTVKADQFAAQVESATTNSYANFMEKVKLAVLMGIDYSFTDYLVDHVDNQFSLPVRALVNGDGQAIPPGPNGEQFDANTHNHYMASAALTNTWAVALVENVLEHNADGSAKIWINRADASAWEALADFKELVYDKTIKSMTQEYGVGDLEVVDINNRQIGWFHGAEVWIKPFWPANYPFVWRQLEGKQPLAMRLRGTTADGGEAVEGAGDLLLNFENEQAPLRSTGWYQEYGIGVYNRTSAAVGYVGGANYVQPSLTVISSAV